MTNKKPDILVLCTGNSCRSQMAEGWIRHLGGERLTVSSAGLEPAGIHPLASQVMNEVGIDISGQSSTPVDQYEKYSFNYLLTVCDHAKEHCPVFPGAVNRVHKAFRDPAVVEGSHEKKLNMFRDTRDRIGDFIRHFLSEELELDVPNS